MKGAAAARCWQKDDDLFDRIGAFLAEQRLSIDPAHYAFAHHVLSDPDGTVASAVARLTAADQMGDLFKAAAIFSPRSLTVPGFEA